MADNVTPFACSQNRTAKQNIETKYSVNKNLENTILSLTASVPATSFSRIKL